MADGGPSPAPDLQPPPPAGPAPHDARGPAQPAGSLCPARAGGPFRLRGQGLPLRGDPPPQGIRMRIVIVEDEPPAAALLRETLQSLRPAATIVATCPSV